MKEYDPESGTYQNMEVDPETKEVHYGELNPNEDKIVYKFNKITHLPLFSKWWFWVICAVVVIAPWVVVLVVHLPDSSDEKSDPKEITKEVVKEAVKEVKSEEIDNNAGTLTIIDSSAKGDAYTEMIDTMFQEHQLHIYHVRYGIPELYVCDSVNIDTNDMNIVFAAQAAEYSKDPNQPKKLLGLFIKDGEILATGSKSKEGFCAIINHNISLGAGKTTPLSEEAINEKGDFFRNPPLVVNGIAQKSNIKHSGYRRALCSYNNEIVYIVCDEKMTLTDFAQLLSDFGVVTAVNMMGSLGAICFCRDQEGKLHYQGVNKYDTYESVNYLIWKKK